MISIHTYENLRSAWFSKPLACVSRLHCVTNCRRRSRFKKHPFMISRFLGRRSWYGSPGRSARGLPGCHRGAAAWSPGLSPRLPWLFAESGPAYSYRTEVPALCRQSARVSPSSSRPCRATMGPSPDLSPSRELTSSEPAGDSVLYLLSEKTSALCYGSQLIRSGSPGMSL